MTVTHKPVTAEEPLWMPDEGIRRRLLAGEVWDMNPAVNVHGRVAARLPQYVEDRKLGTVFAAETGSEISNNLDTGRAPDVAVALCERVEVAGEVKGYWPGASDLAVEVVSPDDSYASIEKAATWLEAGTHAVVVVEPRTKTVMMLSSRTELRIFTEGDVGDAMPGWTVPVDGISG